MCVSRCWWMGCRRVRSPILPLILLLPLSLLFSTPPFTQGAIHIPKHYKIENMLEPPVLTELPTSYTAFSREDISLPCEASGNPTPIFRWVKDGEAFGEEMKSSGTLYAQEDEPLESYAGYYRCYASNTLGTAMTDTIKVIVEPQPVLVKQYKVHKKASQGESLILTCNPPESSTPPLIHWMDKKMVHIKQSDRVIIGLDGNLYFSNLHLSDSREDYICNAQYVAARTILPETSIRLTVMPSNNVDHYRKPKLFHPSGPRTSVQTLRGHSVTLECIPEGLPTPKVEWKKKDGHLNKTSGQLENHNRWLYFDSITQDDDGEYECRAFNSHGYITHPFTVSVEAAPYWLKEPENQQYAPGETVKLDCLAEGIPSPVIFWSINGQPIEEVDDDSRRSISKNALILRDVEYADTAVYQCEATNKHGSILLNTFLFVVELPPQILSSDGVVYRALEGREIMLDCESFGSPRPHVSWERENMVPMLSDPRVSLLTNGTIELTNVSHEDTGVYTCSVQNTNISITANLEVFNQTVILKGPQDFQRLRGTAALLDCNFYSDPRLRNYEIIWKKDGSIIQESSPDDKYTIFENNTLKVANIQLDDSAEYLCEVHTELDRVFATGSITVLAPPSPPSSLSLSNVEDHSLTLSWIPGPSHNSPITDFIVEAREEPNSEEGKWEWKKWTNISGDFNHEQLNLRPFCTYRFRVIAVNEIGKSSPSEPSDDYSTPPAVPDRNPTGVQSISTDPGTLIITWDETEKRLQNGPGFQYKVFWREAKGADSQWKNVTVTSPPLLVNNTGTYTPFEIKVLAVNTIGKGPEPEPKTGHSGEDKPEDAPSGVSTVVMNSTVTVSWNHVQNVRGQLLGYKIYVRRLSPQSHRRRRYLDTHYHVEEKERLEQRNERYKDSWVVEVHGIKNTGKVTDLRLFSKYELELTAFNKKGEGPHSQPHIFNTPEGAPGPPASLTFESPTESSVMLYWSPPLEKNGILLGYMVQYQQEVESQDSNLQMQTFSDAKLNQILLDQLDPNSYYIFKVLARTAAGEGPPITLRGATLLDGVPPSNITIVPSNTAFNFSWLPGKRERNHGFRISYSKSADGRWEESEVVNSTQGVYSLAGLQPGTQYHLKIEHANATLWEVTQRTIRPMPSEMPGGFAARGWLIGLISAIVLLVLILLILCLIKRRKGGKYAVKDKEEKEVDSEARLKDETFGEYRSLESDGDEKRSDSQPSLCDGSKLGSDDSLAEYGESVDIQFNEDGSFIGQYSGRGPAPHGNEGSDPASPANAVPPPPIAPSMSSILNRPS